MSTALVNPNLLSWSRQRAGLTEFEVAKGLPVKPERVFEWEVGSSLPTFKQAQHWATLVHVPFGFLFLSTPPSESLQLPDLRTVSGAAEKPSIDLLETVKDVIRRQDWFLEYLQEQLYDQLPFVGSYTVNSPIQRVVADIRKKLGAQIGQKHSTHEDYLRFLIAGAEACGILVMRSGIVGSNTHRKLNIGEFRGFAISNKHAPVVFINSADAPTARLFTLIHELAHIWIGSSGISSVSINENKKEEIFCNAIAGEFLAPKIEFSAMWNANEILDSNLSIIASYFKVSRLVVARRACDLGFITKEIYSKYYLGELQYFKDRDEGGGGSYYRNAGAKNSIRFSKAVLAETMNGKVLLRDAAKLLGIQPAKIRTYASTLSE